MAQKVGEVGPVQSSGKLSLAVLVGGTRHEKQADLRKDLNTRPRVLGLIWKTVNTQ